MTYQAEFPLVSRQLQVANVLDTLRTTPSEQLESEVLEFKEYRDVHALHNSKELAEEICALANRHGGTLIIGVRDSSNVTHGDWSQQLVGFPPADVTEIKARLEGKLKSCRPLVVCQQTHGDKTYLVVTVQSRPDSLVATSSGKFYIRDGRSSRPMLPEEVANAVKLLTTYDWSGEVVAAGTADIDLDAAHEAIADFSLRRGFVQSPSIEAYLEAIGATHNGRLLNGGLLWLGHPEAISRLLGQYEFRFTWKKPNGELVVNDVWRENLWHSIGRARRHFEGCNMVGDVTYKDKAIKVPAMDRVAFHEALLNAVVHRDYSADGMVAVTYTRSVMTIASPGSFYGGITADNIGRHEPRHRNKALARILMGHHLVDRAGMGVLRMSLGSLKYGRSLPRFAEVEGNVEVAMQAEFLRPGITVISMDDPDLDIPSLLILNRLYQQGHVAVAAIRDELNPLVGDTWQAIKQTVARLPQVELCGTSNGVFMRVTPNWRAVLEVKKPLRTTATSAKHVKLFDYLQQHGEASNADISELLDHSHSSQTSKFLREAKYVLRSGSGPSSRWRLRPTSS